MSPSDRVASALACAALDRDLRGVLLLDLDPRLLAGLGRWLARLWQPKRPPEPALITAASDDRLWTRLRLGTRPPGVRLGPGLLVEHGDQGPTVFLVPDLLRASRPVIEAMTVTLDGDIAHLERDGMSLRWQPCSRWLACCRAADLDKISPHLLDRFPLRVPAGDLRPPILAPPSNRIRRAVAQPVRPVVPATVLKAVVARTSHRGVQTGLALARTATALSSLSRSSEVGETDLARAGELIGLSLRADPDPRPTPDPEPAATDDGSAAAAPDAVGRPGEPLMSDASRLGSAPHAGELYPVEDEPARVPDAPARALLRRPARHEDRRHTVAGRARTVAAPGTSDLAVLATILEAAKYQRHRCPTHFAAAARGEPHRMHIRREDLRQYRRDRQSRLSVVLVVDHTGVQGWDWAAPAKPYLKRAYTSRAPIDIVEVGSADAPVEARATALRARGALDPRLDAVFHRSAGRATPLAHGLRLAALALRRAVRRDRAGNGRALLVVLTDGLGNIPQAASERGELPTRAAAEGVTDALKVARSIRTLSRVSAFVLRPPVVPDDAIVRRLAADLGAALVGPGNDD